jgi:hypothetical protein
VRVPLVVLLLFLARLASSAAQPAEHELPQAPSTIAIGDPLAVFAFVLGAIPEHVFVRPTENYFYVRFGHKGRTYTGNIRLAAGDRDQGKVHFAYGEPPADRKSSPPIRHVVLDGARGVTVEKLAPLSYRVTLAGRAVTFALNDLSGVKPHAEFLRDDEVFLGAVYDESAVRFFLVFNARLKVFHYLLDDMAGAADEWRPAGEAIEIGVRTGFALYLDGPRRVLIGVRARDSRLNTMYDGPFDQIPENFIEGDALRDAIVAADPAVKGKIDRLGHFFDGSGRYLIHPYMLYRDTADLAVFRRCVVSPGVPAAQKPRCLAISDAESRKRRPRPLALEGR